MSFSSSRQILILIERLNERFNFVVKKDFNFDEKM